MCFDSLRGCGGVRVGWRGRVLELPLRVRGGCDKNDFRGASVRVKPQSDAKSRPVDSCTQKRPILENAMACLSQWEHSPTDHHSAEIVSRGNTISSQQSL